MPNRAELGPAEVVAALLACIEERRWDDAWRYVDPAGLAKHYDDRAREAERAWSLPPETAEDFLRNDPGMPREVAEALAESGRRRRELLDERRRLHGWPPTVSDLRAMTPAQVMALALRVADRHEQVGSSGPPPSSADVADRSGMPHHRREVVGEVIRDGSAWVVYLSYWLGSRLVGLRRSDEGWGVLPYGEIFGRGFAVEWPVAEERAALPGPLAVRPPPWIERDFDQVLPVELFPVVLDRFRGAPGRARALVDDTLPWIRTAKPDGGWSIQEHLGHLLDLEELGRRRLADFEAGAATLTAADMSNRATHEAAHNRADPMKLLSRFQEERDALATELARLPRETLEHSARHGRLDRTMNVAEWIWFMCEHDDHHLARMRELHVELTRAWREARSG